MVAPLGNVTSQRIPLALQSVFIESNSGNEVDTPPPQRAASRTFLGGAAAEVNFRPKQTIEPTLMSPHRKPKRIGRRFSLTLPVSQTKHPVEKSRNQATDRIFSIVSPLKLSKQHAIVKTSSLLNEQTFSLESPAKQAKQRAVEKTNSFAHISAKEMRASTGAMSLSNASKVTGSPKKAPRLPSMSPQVYLDGLMSNRGYCTERVAVGKTAFSRTPTPLQKASYHGYLIETIKKGEIDLFRRLMASGLSPNPSNMYGESLCHLVCRLGDHRMLKVMLDCGATTEVCDDFGRTPLHDACWAAKPAFELVDLIMTAGLPNGNHYLFSLTDNRGATPLSYIRQEHWAEWMEFLVKKKDIYWPAMDKSHGKKGPPDITRELPNSRPLPDPMGALPLELANMVASGSILPEEAILLSEEDSTSWSDENKGDSDYLDELDMVRFISNFGDDSDSSSDFEESDNSDCDDDEDEDEDFSEEALCAMFQITKESKERRELSAHDSSDTLKEMAQVLTCLKMSGRQPIVWSS